MTKFYRLIPKDPPKDVPKDRPQNQQEDQPEDQLRLARIYRQLQTIEVYQSKKVLVEWIVKTPEGKTKYGRAESGRVALNSENNILKVSMGAEDIEANVPPLELQEMLAKFAGIEDSHCIMLLSHLLAQKDMLAMEHELQRRGISNDLPELERVIGKAEPSRNRDDLDEN
jgi:hypothetical protein